MRNIQSNISNVGINLIGQGITLIVRGDVRPLRAYLSALLRYASRLSANMRDARWQWSTGMFAMAVVAMQPAKQPARCFATAKQHERHARVTGFRSVA